ncbi:MAG TPA: hypothetical protein VMT08_08880 [Bradyrhizobium sp.]|nr:hypothetical protein [Bradyrhizobium sp.]
MSVVPVVTVNVCPLTVVDADRVAKPIRIEELTPLRQSNIANYLLYARTLLNAVNLPYDRRVKDKAERSCLVRPNKIRPGLMQIGHAKRVDTVWTGTSASDGRLNPDRSDCDQPRPLSCAALTHADL